MVDRFEGRANHLYLTAYSQAQCQQKYIEQKVCYHYTGNEQCLDDEKRIVVFVVRLVGCQKRQIQNVPTVVSDKTVEVLNRSYNVAEHPVTSYVKYD